MYAPSYSSDRLSLRFFRWFAEPATFRADTLTQAHILSLSRTIYLCPSSEKLHRARQRRIDK